MHPGDLNQLVLSGKNVLLLSAVLDQGRATTLPQVSVPGAQNELPGSPGRQRMGGVTAWLIPGTVEQQEGHNWVGGTAGAAV